MQEQEDPLDIFIHLQKIYLCQEIAKQLEERGHHDPNLPEKLIQLSQTSTSQQDFIQQVIPLVTISQHFLISLYTNIKQKLPQKQQLLNNNQNILDKQQRLVPIVHEVSNQLEQQQAHHLVSKYQFPGLCLPNNENMEQDEDVKEQIREKNNVVQDRSIKEQKNEQKHQYQSRRRSKSRSSDRNKVRRKKQRRSYSRNSSQSYRRHQKRKQIKKKKKDSKKYKRSKSKSGQQEISKVEPIIQKPEVGKIYKGTVTRVQKIGCFVKLHNLQYQGTAILHHTQIKQSPSPTNFLKEGFRIWVKVIAIMEDRIRLSMKEVNQRNGLQYYQHKKEEKTQKEKLEEGRITGIKIHDQQEVNQEGQGSSCAQLWETSRMKSMGGLTKSKGLAQEEIQEINIEMNQRQPPFLRGQTTKAGINLSPVRVVKNPEGTLQREALNAVQYARQRRQIRQQQNKQQSNDLTQILDEVTPRQELKKMHRRVPMTIKQQKTSLPIHNYRQQLVKACCENKVLIVIGETGSGKTTQITQYLYHHGLAKKGKIGCTQPRRVAAMSVAKRVCEEMGVKMGEQVGYSIRFEDCTSSKTVIKYMTDGMLLREALIDKYLNQYSVIMLDEAHQRTIHTDVLFGILKKVVQKRNDFHLIVTSATLEAKKFSSYFFDCKIFSIPGRTYNVQILYSKEPQTDYLDAALMCVMQIHLDQPPGDILLFLTGQEEIDTTCQILTERLKKFGPDVPELIILPVYSALPSQLQTRIFQPAPKGKRKCVIATNIAEASLTIDGIFYVVDPGFAKIKIYNSKLGMDTLVVAPISQASAKQRAGRAGRTGPGKCYRIYTEEAYKNEMLPTSVPQIQRANLSNTVLELKAMGINDLINFDFMDPPPVQTLIAALEQLYYLSALDDQGLLTKLGRKMAEFPLEPPLSKMLLTSVDLGCCEQIVTIISMLSVQNIFYRPKQKQTIADQKKTKFNHHQGDHLTYLSVFDAWKNQNYSVQWCHQNFIQFRSLKRAQDVKKQIVELLQRYKFSTTSCNGNYSIVRKTIVSGFFFHAARKDPKGGYRTLVDDHQVYIHPSSSLFNKQPQWVVYHQLIFTTKQYMRDVCAINPKWLIDVAPNFFKYTDDIGFTRKKRNEKLDPLNQKYGDPNAWRLSKRKG